MKAPPRKRILQIIRDADLSLARSATVSSANKPPRLVEAFKSAIQKIKQRAEDANLAASLEQLLNEYRHRPPFSEASPDAVRDYLILMQLQVEELKQEIFEFKEELWEGTYDVFWRLAKEKLLSKDPQVRAAAQQQIDQARQAWRENKQREKARRDAERMKSVDEYRRNRPPEKRSDVNWFADMPVYSETPPYGYVQATQQERRTVERFIAELGAVSVRKPPRPGPGKRKSLYGFDVNLRILDQWLGTWLPQEPNQIADAIIDALLYSAKEPHTPEQAAQLRACLSRHWKRVIGQVTDQDILDLAPCFELDFLADNQAWLRILPQLRLEFHKADAEAQANDPPIDSDLLRFL